MKNVDIKEKIMIAYPFLLGMIMVLTLIFGINDKESNDSLIGYGQSNNGIVFAYYNFDNEVYTCPMVKNYYDCEHFMTYDEFVKLIE